MPVPNEKDKILEVLLQLQAFFNEHAASSTELKVRQLSFMGWLAAAGVNKVCSLSKPSLL